MKLEHFFILYTKIIHNGLKTKSKARKANPRAAAFLALVHHVLCVGWRWWYSAGFVVVHAGAFRPNHAKSCQGYTRSSSAAPQFIPSHLAKSRILAGAWQ